MKVLLILWFIIFKTLFSTILNSGINNYIRNLKDLQISISYYIEQIILNTLPYDQTYNNYINLNLCLNKIISLDKNSEDLMNSVFQSSLHFRISEDLETCFLDDKLNVLVKFFYYDPFSISFYFKEIKLCIFFECENVISLILSKNNTKLEKYIENQFNILFYLKDYRIMRRGDEPNLLIREDFRDINDINDSKSPYGTKNKIFILKNILIVLWLYFGFRVFIWIFYKNVSKNRVFLKLLTQTIKFLYKFKNILYDESNLDRFSFLFFISLFGINYHILISTFIIAPLDILNISESRRLKVLKIFDRLSCHAFYLYIILRGLTFSFKLSTYLENKEKSIKNFLKFYLKNIFNVLFFFLVFLFYNMFYRELFSIITVKFNPTSKNLHYLYWNNCRENSILQYLIPFYVNFKNTQIKNYYSLIKRHPCDIDYILLSSEFCLFTFFMILLFVIYKIKSKFFEKALFVLFLIIYFLIMIEESYFKMNYWFIIEYPFFKFPLQIQNLIVPYFLGIIAGILFYYHKNLMLFVSFKELGLFNSKILELPKKEKNTNHHFPFKFLLKINKFFHRKSDIWKRSIKLITMMLVIINASISSFNESSNINLHNYNSYLIMFYFMNDSHFFTLIIYLYILIQFYEEKSPLNKYFIVINRCSLPFLLNCIFVSGLIYLIYDITNIYNFYVNVILTFGCFIITFLFAVFFQVMFAIPLKFIWKKYII